MVLEKLHPQTRKSENNILLNMLNMSDIYEINKTEKISILNFILRIIKKMHLKFVRYLKQNSPYFGRLVQMQRDVKIGHFFCPYCRRMVSEANLQVGPQSRSSRECSVVMCRVQVFQSLGEACWCGGRIDYCTDFAAVQPFCCIRLFDAKEFAL